MVRTAVVPLGRNLENDQWTPQRRTSEERLNAISGLLIARHAVGEQTRLAPQTGADFLPEPIHAFVRRRERRVVRDTRVLVVRGRHPGRGRASSEAARLGKEFLVQIRQWEKSKNKIKVSVLHGQTVLGFGKGPIRGFRCPTEPFQHASATRRYPG